VERRTAVVVGGLGLAVIVMGVFLAGQGLDQADKWASVLGLFLNVVGALAAMASLWLVLDRRSADDRHVTGGLETEPLRQSDPRRVGGLRLLGRLGSGAAGVVYLGRAPAGQYAAVKVVRSDLADDPVFRHRFAHEVRCVARLRGRHFLQLMASDPAAERPWLATFYEPGVALGTAVADAGPWEPAAVGRLAGGLAEALRDIHAQGIVHRDLTPWNILVSDDGPMVVDFGIARAADDTRLTRTGAPMGTVAFMSPEQASGADEIGPAADVFALGSLLVFAATGRPPFGEDGADTVLSRIRLRRPNLGPLAGSRDPLVALIRSCLSKNPADRPEPAEIVRVCQPYLDRPGAELLPDVVLARIARQRAIVARGAPSARGARPGSAADGEHPAPPRVPWFTRGRLVRTALVFVVVVAVGMTSYIRWWPWQSSLDPCTGTPDEILRVASSADKSHLLRDEATAYGQREADGRCVRVVVDEHNSGSAMEALAAGWTESDGERPDVWSPASREWLHLARHRADNGGSTAVAQVLPATEPESIVTTPLVIAMPMEMARQLGWPDSRDIGWQTLARLATQEDGWGGERRPEWGDFLIGKTNPQYSTSGLNATIGMFHIARADDRRTALGREDVADLATATYVRSVERSIAHYGETSLHFLNNLRHAAEEGRPLDYVSAVTVEESSMLAYNAGYANGTSSEAPTGEPTTKLAAIHPVEGTIHSDHPYIELAWPDTSEAERQVSADFLEHLHSRPAQRRFQDLGFRDHKGNPGPLATADHGAVPDAEITELPLPDAETIDAVMNKWTELRKPANVLLVLDVSRSMNEGVTHKLAAAQSCPDEQKVADKDVRRCPTKLERVKEAAAPIVDGFTGADKVGLWEFSQDIDGEADHRELVAAGPLTETQKLRLVGAVDALAPRTDTALYDTLSLAVDTVRANYDDGAINAVVVLSDGADNTNPLGLEPLLRKLEDPEEPVRVFTIAYGIGSVEDRNGQLALQQIADASGGARYEAKDSRRIIDELVAAVVSNF
jgi:predicted Ser/Thr protein kinase